MAMFREVDLTQGRPKGQQKDQTRASEIVPVRGGEQVYMDGWTAGQERGGSGRSVEGFDAGRREREWGGGEISQAHNICWEQLFCRKTEDEGNSSAAVTSPLCPRVDLGDNSIHATGQCAGPVASLLVCATRASTWNLATGRSEY